MLGLVIVDFDSRSTGTVIDASIPNESRVELEIRLAIREGGERKSKSRGIELIIVETWLTNLLSSYSDNIIQYNIIQYNNCEDPL